MKTGVIVCVMGTPHSTGDFDESTAQQNLDIRADRIAFMFSGDSDQELSRLWLEMTQKGMSRIVCMAGELTGPSTIRLTGRELRLSGYSA